MIRQLAPFVLTLWAAPLAAHPHVFIDTQLSLVADDQGQLTHVRVTWEYDALYSLLVTEDMGLDADGDGALTETELATLNGFDMQWVDGFNGDLVISTEANTIALSGPTEIATQFDNGQITTMHTRALETAIPAGTAITIKPYDATYYTAYDITTAIDTTRAPTCRARVAMPDVTATMEALQQQLAQLDAQTDPSDAGLPDIGAQMAPTVNVTCAAP